MPLLPAPEWKQDFGASRANPVKMRARIAANLRVDLYRVCARATLPLSGQAGVLKTDSETFAIVLVLTMGDFLLRSKCLVGFDLGHMRGLLRYIETERRWQLLAVVGEKLCIVRSARNGDVGHAAVEQILSA